MATPPSMTMHPAYQIPVLGHGLRAMASFADASCQGVAYHLPGQQLGPTDLYIPSQAQRDKAIAEATRTFRSSEVVSEDLNRVIENIDGIDPEKKQKRFNQFFASQAWFDYSLSLLVGGEGRRQQRLDAEEAENNPFLNPSSVGEDAGVGDKAIGALGSGAAFLFGPDNYDEFKKDQAQQDAANDRGNFLYSFESFMRALSGRFFRQIFQGSRRECAEIAAELNETDVPDSVKSKYLERLLDFTRAEYRFQNGEIGMMRYYASYVAFRALTAFRPRKDGPIRRVGKWFLGGVGAVIDKINPVSILARRRARRQAKEEAKATEGITERLKNPELYLSPAEIESFKRLEKYGPSSMKERAQLLALKALVAKGIPYEKRAEYKAMHNADRSKHKGNAKISALVMYPLGKVMGSAALGFMHYSDVRVALAATRTYPMQILEIIASEDDSAKGGVLRVLFKGSGSEVGKGMMAAYSLAMGGYILFSMSTGMTSTEVNTTGGVFDELVQARKNMPAVIQAPITGMFVAGAGLMLTAIDGPKLVKSHLNFFRNLFTKGRLEPSTPTKLGDLASVISSYIGTMASSTSIAAFWYYSRMIDMALGFYLSSIAASLDYAQTRFDNAVLDRAAKRQKPQED